jgi:hypothetical protein
MAAETIAFDAMVRALCIVLKAGDALLSATPEAFLANE